MYIIKLNDGTIINAELNGNNFIPDNLDRNIFIRNLDKITVTDDDGHAEELYNQKVQFAKVGDKESFILSNKTENEIEKEGLMLALAQLDMQREIDKTETQLALADLANVLLGGVE